VGDNLLPSSGASITNVLFVMATASLVEPTMRSGGPSCVLGVKGKVLAIDLPHELRAKFNGLFELLFCLGL
jgi:hypothetical protein